jgi:hypothetical protein
MPADFAFPSLNSDKCPKCDSAELGHFEALWDIERSFSVAEFRIFPSLQMANDK